MNDSSNNVANLGGTLQTTGVMTLVDEAETIQVPEWDGEDDNCGEQITEASLPAIIHALSDLQAERTVSVYQFSVLNGALVVTARVKRYTADVDISPRYLQDAMFQDLRSEWRIDDSSHDSLRDCYPAVIDPCSLDIALFDSNDDPKEVTNWEGWETLAAITFKPKKGKHAGNKISRAKKIISLLAEVRNLATEIETGNIRLRRFQERAPVPHGVSGELTVGSTQEMRQQAAAIDALEKKQIEKLDAINKHVAVLNAKFPVQDTGWQAPLPAILEDLMSHNASANADGEDDE